VEDRLRLNAEDRNALLDLKARYFRYVDTKDWGLFAPLFAADATLRPIDDLPGFSFDGAVGVRYGVSRAMNDVVSMHHGFTPELEMVSPDEANGIWPMEDRLWFGADSAAPGLIVHDFGHYHGRYTRIEGHRRFRSVELHRLRVETRNANPALPENR